MTVEGSGFNGFRTEGFGVSRGVGRCFEFSVEATAATGFAASLFLYRTLRWGCRVSELSLTGGRGGIETK